MNELAVIPWTAVLLTVRLALLTTFFLMILVVPLAWWLTRRETLWRELLSTVLTVPLVLPPTVLGFYLLLTLGKNSPLGVIAQRLFDTSLTFSFVGLVIGSMIYSLPFMLQPIQNAFIALGQRPLDVAATLGCSPLRRFFVVVLPMAKRGILTGCIMAFAHTLGEFGVVMMIGGSIPGETKVLSIAIYENVDTNNYFSAHVLSAGLVVFAVAVIFVTARLNKKHAII